MAKDHDFAINAKRIVDEVAQKSEKNPNAVALGRLGGLKGGRARFAKLTPEQRKEIAQKAARKRWGENKANQI